MCDAVEALLHRLERFAREAAPLEVLRSPRPWAREPG
jgi:hypothetical protein